MKNKILNIGSITKDVIIIDTDEYNQIGGAVYYQLSTFNQLKIPYTSIIMVGNDDVEMLDNLPDTKNIKIIKNSSTMEYVNIYKNNTRIQKAYFPKEELTIFQLQELNLTLNEYKYVILSPLSPYEIKPELIQYLKEKSLKTVLLIQGFIRSIDINHEVSYKSWPNHEKYLKYVDIIASDEDEFKKAFNISNLTNEEILKILDKNNLEVIIITKASKGSTIYTEDEIINIPVIKTHKEVDFTGLGDTYTASYISKLDEYGYKKAGLFASLVAKEKLENKGGLKTSKKEIMKKFNKILNQNA